MLQGEQSRFAINFEIRWNTNEKNRYDARGEGGAKQRKVRLNP